MQGCLDLLLRQCLTIDQANQGLVSRIMLLLRL
jgi:hypothetical protein